MQLSSTEKDAWSVFYTRFAPPIFAYLVQQVASRQDAEDLLLEVFFSAHQYTICQGSDGYGWPSGTAANRGDWPPLSTRVVQRPACNGSGLTFAQWKFAVGAIGYEVVQGQYGQYSGPTN